ncbi:hypothetical protein [Deinococcus sp.]|uniref:hypothetical protein n=1 Tax=Deinococcus sp. TaxID=47478 RepID=UPI0025E34DEB|nr:hypothetical protein [Deinococcus sp.]
MFTFPEAATLPPRRVGQESLLLGRYASRLPNAFVLDADFEEGFYRRANLPEQLRRLFAGVNPRRIDEDLLEVLCHTASRLVRTSALMDDSVQLFLRALNNSGVLGGQPGNTPDAEFHLRRPDERRSERGHGRLPGSEVLFALKRLWANDWLFDALVARLDTAGSIALEARPALIFAGPPGTPDPELAEALGAFEAWQSPLGLVGLA